jgi:hypothetical protein
MQQSQDKILTQLQAELDALDNDPIEVDGQQMKASQCYHLDVSPAHVLFNTNCPDTLKEKINRILAKYVNHESGAQ